MKRMIPPDTGRFPRAGGRQGMALILTLSAVALLTGLVLAFFSRSLINHQIVFSSTGMITTEVMARSSLDLIVGQIRDEIIDPNHSTVLQGVPVSPSYPKFYKPKTPADALSEKVGISGANAAGAVTLVKVSASGKGIRSDGPVNLVATSVGINTASRNGRSISQTRWFGSGGPRLGSQGAMPTWMLITRGSAVKVPTPANASDSTSDDYVIGRFAYTVYDISGLLDANAAGGDATISDASDTGAKGGLAYADISILGLNPANVTNWRNPSIKGDSIAYREWATGLLKTASTKKSATLEVARSGHLNTVLGDNAIFSRRDLLNNSIFSGYAGNLTHFSRTLNAPSYGPEAPTDTNPNLVDARFSKPATIIHYRDDGSTYSYTVRAGDSLLQRRFSLAKLAWLGQSGPNDAAFNSSLTSAEKTQAIRACFGLVWDSSSNPPHQPHWDYKELLGGANTIRTLSLVAVLSTSREPNFFELLKAGILQGSLGRASDNVTLVASGQQTLEGKKDLQILQIGANMIDCADADNYPSTIELGGIPVHGIEDLPYLYGIAVCWLGQYSYVSDTKNQVDWATMVGAPILFNPHRNVSTMVGANDKIRIRILGGTLNSTTLPIALTTPPGFTFSQPGGSDSDLSDRTPIEIPSASYDAFRTAARSPLNTEASTSSTMLSNIIVSPNSVAGPSAKVHGFRFCTITGTPRGYSTSNNGNPNNVAFSSDVASLMIVMEYCNPADGKWYIYDTLAGNEALPVTAGITTTNFQYGFTLTSFASGATGAKKTKSDAFGWGQFKLDPRSTRFGIGTSGTYDNFTPGVNSPCPGNGANEGITGNFTLSPSTFAKPGSFPGLWVQGGTTNCTGANINTMNVSDPDSTVRPADGWINASGTTLGVANLFKEIGTGTYNARPVVLQRPFQNVAELGYVFRGSPWKTLSFFDKSSGDGALLDIFTVSDAERTIAGRVGLNSAQSKIQESLLSGAAQAPEGNGVLSASNALSKLYQSYVYNLGAPTANMPVTVANLPQFISDNQTTLTSDSVDAVKYRRESITRSLAGSAQTRTWNFLIDVVAQSGRYPAGAQNLADFIVTGEKRYWLSIAIDRYTGTVLDRQLEPVNE